MFTTTTSTGFSRLIFWLLTYVVRDPCELGASHPSPAGCVAAGLLVKSSTPSRCEKQNGEQNPRALASCE